MTSIGVEVLSCTAAEVAADETFASVVEGAAVIVVGDVSAAEAFGFAITSAEEIAESLGVFGIVESAGAGCGSTP